MLRLDSKKGQAVVETALILPILLLVLLGIFEFGRIFNANLILVNASREGARKAVVGASNLEILDAVNFSLATLDNTAVVTVITPETTRVSGEAVTVQVDYQLTIITPIIGSIIPNPFPVSSKTSMRVE